MSSVGLLVVMRAKPGKEGDLTRFLESALALHAARNSGAEQEVNEDEPVPGEEQESASEEGRQV